MGSGVRLRSTAEVFFSPADFLPAGLQPQRLTEAIRRGLDQVREVEVALVADLVRDYGLGFSRAEILRLIEQGIETSWLLAERKRELLDEFRTEFLTLEPDVT